MIIALDRAPDRAKFTVLAENYRSVKDLFVSPPRAFAWTHPSLYVSKSLKGQELNYQENYAFHERSRSPLKS